jgi:hypothetical protein
MMAIIAKEAFIAVFLLFYFIFFYRFILLKIPKEFIIED